ncbi:MAG: response regulator [Anaerolineaceae bacterium]|nr:response regulator [Anaerolineaceae bacterium]
MSKPRLLVVEDDNDIANMLKIYFSSQGYDVDTASSGSIAIECTKQVMPHLIVLDIMLPDTNGYEVCRQLRMNLRTSHIPVIFLTQKDERSDKLQGLELGADDYITKPFDIEELKLRVQNAIKRAERESLTDPHSGLPAGRLIEDQLRRFIREEDWNLLDIGINHYEAFKNSYGFIAANDVLRFCSLLFGEICDQFEATNDFIGHAGGDNFIIITNDRIGEDLKRRLKSQFVEEIGTHYNFIDRQQGFVRSINEKGEEEKTELMTLSIGIISPATHQFSDIREITELAIEQRRRDSVN